MNDTVHPVHNTRPKMSETFANKTTLAAIT